MSDKFSCDKCGKEFDSERGLHIHQSQVHTGEDEENETGETAEQNSEESSGKEIVFSFSSGKTILASFVLGLLLGGFLVGSAGSIGLPVNGLLNESTDSRIDFAASDFSDDPTLGSADAPVRIVEVTDYGCPWCAEWKGVNAIPSRNIDQTQTYQKIKNNYIDSGEVKMTVLDYPAHPNAIQMHKAANCVYEQDPESYSEFSIKMYETREEWLGGRSGADRPRETIRSVADTVGLNGTEVLQCVDSKDNSEIEEDVSMVSSKVDRVGTPLFFIGNEENGYVKVSGAQTYSTISKIIEQEIQNAN